jgi:hypothetical protein
LQHLCKSTDKRGTFGFQSAWTQESWSFYHMLHQICNTLSADGQTLNRQSAKIWICLQPVQSASALVSLTSGSQASRFSGSSHCRQTPAGLTLDRSSVDCFHDASNFGSSRGFRTSKRCSRTTWQKSDGEPTSFTMVGSPVAVSGDGRIVSMPCRFPKTMSVKYRSPTCEHKGNRVLQQLLIKLQSCSNCNDSLAFCCASSLLKTSGTFLMWPSIETVRLCARAGCPRFRTFESNHLGIFP